MSGGFLLAVEGLDGAGKRSVTQALALRASEQGLTVVDFTFPRYGTPTGDAIARYLQSPTPDLSPMAAAMLFAADRLMAREELIHALGAGALVLVDRYVSSNVAYQAGRVAPEERESFAAWVEQLEYGLMELPRPNFTVYLDVTLGDSSSRTASRALESGRPTDDHYETDADLLLAATAQYRNLVRNTGWVSVDVSSMALESVIDCCWDELSARITHP